MSKFIDIKWTKIISSSESASAHAVEIATDGSLYITGTTDENSDDRSDIFLSKYNSEGIEEWTQLIGASVYTFGLGGQLKASDISEVNDNILYLTGWTDEDLDDQINSGDNDTFLIKFNSSGEKELLSLFGGRWHIGSISVSGIDQGVSINIDNDGSIFIVGDTGSDLDGQNNNGSFDTFISKFNSSGEKIWTTLLGTEETEWVESSLIDNDGSIYLTGSTEGDLEDQQNNGGNDIYLTKLDSEGIKQWTNLWGNSDGDYPDSISIDNHGNIFLVGEIKESPSSPTIYGFLKKINSLGEEQWHINLGMNDGEDEWNQRNGEYRPQDVIIASDGSIFVTGYTGYKPTMGGWKYSSFLTKFNAEGIKQWTELIGTEDDTSYRSTAINISDDNSIFLTGYKGSNRKTDAFIMKLTELYPPSKINISINSINENIISDSVIATISSTDKDSDNTHAYSLVDGMGDIDNENFSIDDDQLKINISPDYETQSSYNIRLKTTDSDGLSYEKSITLNVNDIGDNQINPTTGEIYRELEQGTNQAEEINMNQLQTWFGGTSESEPTETSTNLPIYAQPKGGADYIHFDSGSTSNNNGLQTYGREERSILLSNDLDLSADDGTYIARHLKMGSTSDGVYDSWYRSVYAFENGKVSDIYFDITGKNRFTDVIVDVMEEGDPNRLPTLNIYLTDSSNGDAYFLQDTYSDHFESLETQTDAFGRSYIPRYQNINALYAGEGDDVILDSDGKVYGGNGDDLIVSHFNTEVWGGDGYDTFSFLANPAKTNLGDDIAPIHVLHDFQTGVDTIYLSSKSGDFYSEEIIRTEDGNIQWQYDQVLGSSNQLNPVMTLDMNGATWSESDINFYQYEPDIFSGGTNYLA